MSLTSAFGLILAWGLYGAVHSLLASESVKVAAMRRWPAWAPYYRVTYNVFALLSLWPVVGLTLRYPGEPLWHWPAWVAWPALIFAVAGFVVSLRSYDGLEFLGVRALRGEGNAGDRLVFSPLHRYVRHPWYALGLLVLWTRDLNAAWLIAALVITLYVAIGLRLEERKLVRWHGERYRAYQRRVPALIPWPGRTLDAREAAAWMTGK